MNNVDSLFRAVLEAQVEHVGNVCAILLMAFA